MTTATTVSTASMACMAVSGALALVFPIALFLYLRRRYKARFFPVLVGAAAFVLFALVLEQLFAALLMSSPTVKGFLTSRWWVFALYGGLQAGLFEETGRLCAFALLLRRRTNSLGNTLAYGVGHGGVEALLLLVLPMVSNLVYASVLNAGGLEALAALAPGSGAVMENLAKVLASTPPANFLAGGLERLVAISFHLAASTLVWMAVSGRGPWGLYALAILFHTLVNLPAGAYQYGVFPNIWLVELVTAVLVAGVCFVTLQLYHKCSQTYSPLLDYNPTDFGI